MPFLRGVLNHTLSHKNKKKRFFPELKLNRNVRRLNVKKDVKTKKTKKNLKKKSKKDFKRISIKNIKRMSKKSKKMQKKM